MVQSPVVITPTETLTRINLADMLDNFGLSRSRLGRGLIEGLGRGPARTLAEQALRFDQCVAEAGIQAAAQQWLRAWINRLDVIGAQHIPSSGGVIFAANHPGMVDTLACLGSVPRPDLRLVSADRPFMRTLEHTAQRTFFVSDRPDERLTMVRQVGRYLRQGGAVLIWPAGKIEPDPAVMAGAEESLQDWSDSLGTFVRLAPQVVVVPLVVSGVVYGPALHHPLTRLRRSSRDRERVAATLQVIWQCTGRLARHLNVRIEFGSPLTAAELSQNGRAANHAAITREVTSAVQQLLARLKSEQTSQPPEPAYRLMNAT